MGIISVKKSKVFSASKKVNNGSKEKLYPDTFVRLSSDELDSLRIKSYSYLL